MKQDRRGINGQFCSVDGAQRNWERLGCDSLPTQASASTTRYTELKRHLARGGYVSLVVVNPRRACAARVTVVGLSVFVCRRLFSHYRLRGGL